MRGVLRFLVFGFILLVCVPVSRNDTNTRRDGNWWRELDRPEKISYMLGFFDGMDLGHDFSYWPLLKDDKDSSVAKIATAYHEYVSKYLSNVTNVQLVDGLDTFFSDYRNRRIETSNAVWLVLNEISGKPEAEMQQMIEKWRKNSAQ